MNEQEYMDFQLSLIANAEVHKADNPNAQDPIVHKPSAEMPQKKDRQDEVQIDSQMDNEEDEGEDDAWPSDNDAQEEEWPADNEDEQWPSEDNEDTNEIYNQIPISMTEKSISQQFDASQVKCYKMKEVEKNQLPKRINALKELLFIEDNDKIIAILRHFNWNQAKVEENWFAAQECLEKEIGLVYDKALTKKYPDITDRLAANNNNMCNVMYMDFDENDADMKADQLICGHQFSGMCWRNQLQMKVKEDGPNCVFTKCPQIRCNVVVPHSYFKKYLIDKELDDGINYYQKYITWHCKQFTDHNKNIKWCPQKNCNYIIEKSEYLNNQIVSCKCGKQFCFRCNLPEDHLPTDCKNVERWLEKEKNDSENLTWIKANCKPCPKCNANIEKNQGCMHMTCRECNHGFCWLCLQDWKEHGSKTGGYYACKLYDTLKENNKEFQAREDIIANSKSELQKYVFHFERYNNHSKSREICIKNIDKIRKNVRLLNEVKNYPAGELNFFEECSNIIIQCRQVLKWTYPIAYYAEKEWKKNEMELFKFQQGELEEKCEQTQGILEKDLTPYLDVTIVDRSPFYKYKADTVNHSQVLEQQFKQFCSIIMQHE